MARISGKDVVRIFGTRSTDGNYYGTTYFGGDNGVGTVFKMTPQGTVSILHSFSGIDGSNPYAPLVEGADGNLYGTTLNGVNSGDGLGTIFRMAKDGTGFVPIHSLPAVSPEGCYPEGATLFSPVVRGSDAIYGVVGNGDCSLEMPFYRISYAGTFGIVGHVGDTFSTSGLTRGSDGAFYGATEGATFGTIYRITEAGVYTKLYDLSQADGYAQTGEMVFGPDGALYGTASGGGAFSTINGCDTNFNCGTVFKFDPVTATYTVLHSFSADDEAGREPIAGLVEGSDGAYYGVTAQGTATAVGGALFRITPDGTISTLHIFDYGTGSDARGELIQPLPGEFVGTTFGGGSANGSAGVVFRFTLGNTTTTSLATSTHASVFGQQVTLTATVSAAGNPTGQVTFLDGNTSLGTGPVSAGTATLTTSGLAVGAHTISSSYVGDGTFLPSTSQSETVTVSRDLTTTTLGSSANPSSRKQTVMLTATVSAVAPGSGIATGQVQFFDGKKKVGTATLVNGVATLRVAFNSMGAHDLTATYNGNASFLGSSTVFTQKVNK